jgi:hypothetical protein
VEAILFRIFLSKYKNNNNNNNNKFNREITRSLVLPAAVATEGRTLLSAIEQREVYGRSFKVRRANIQACIPTLHLYRFQV